MKGIAAIFLLMVASSAAIARDAHRPSAEEIAAALRLSDGALSRSLLPGRGVQVEQPTDPVSRPALDLEVNFAFNSADLTTDAMLTLDQLGLALNDQTLIVAHIQIAGHTDDVGTADYNQRLSEARAAAVRSYVISAHAIEKDRLAVVGFGESQLLDPADPGGAINRRVRITRTE